MRFLFVLLLVISPLTHAQRSLGREQFMINVRPVLNGILNDFYQMITVFPEFPKEIVPLIQELDNLTTDKETLRETCPRLINSKCRETIDIIRGKLQKIRSQSLKLMKEQKMTSSPYLSTLIGVRLITEFDAEAEEVKGLLDNTAFLIAAKVPHKRETYYILKELDELNTILSLAVVEYIPFMYKDDFRHFYFNYVNPIQMQISKSTNYEFVNRNINSLNFSINLLNMTLTKRKKTPEGMSSFLSVIHNRWNSILRYYY